MTKRQKTALMMDLLPVALAIAVPLLEAKVKSMLTPPTPPPAGRVKWFVVAGFLIYAAFIALTVVLVKLAWRWIL